MKQEVDTLDAIPSKRLFLSIIADYDLNRSICELVDNGLDVWIRGGRKRQITIEILLDEIQQTITVEDNAGGLPRSELRYIVGPGQTGTTPSDETIGLFGVGSKRAVVALAQDIKIKTRYPKEKTYQVDITEDWLADEYNWQLPLYEVNEMLEGKTVVQLQRLRVHVTDEAVAHLKDHLRATYAKFLSDKSVTLKVNGDEIQPQFFENWAYPPKYPPHRYKGSLATPEHGSVKVEVVAGLALESSPATGEYGVYFYCNDRLIARGLKTFDVGFIKGFAGLPHPKVSLTRVLVSLKGDARAMPWNSSKSDISTKHPVFIALHDWLVEVVKDYAALSRIWMGDWPDKVFKYDTGTIEEVTITNFPSATKSYLPGPPRSRPRYDEKITNKNRLVAKQKPWTKGLYEGIIAADLIFKHKRLEQKNRIALIVLDSTLEIAFKEYLVNESGQHYPPKSLATIFGARHLVHVEIKKYVRISDIIWSKISYYYNLRCKLVHEKTTVGIHDAEIEDFRDVVESVLKKLFKLQF